jgi:hypothetical protein
MVGLAELPESNSPSVIFFCGTTGFGSEGGGVFSAVFIFGASGTSVGFTTGGVSILGVTTGGGGVGTFGSSRNSANTFGGGGGTGFTMIGLSNVGAINVTDSCRAVTSCTASFGNQTTTLTRNTTAAI